MILKKTVKLPDGAEFTANLNEEQLNFLLNIALGFLMQNGALPYANVTDDNLSSFVPMSETTQ